MEIRVYDRDLNFLGVVENQISLIWTRKYHEPGNFELRVPITSNNLALLHLGNIITRRDKTLKSGVTEAGVIESLENEDDDIKSEAIRSGRFLSSYLDRRLIESRVDFSGSVELAMRRLVSAVIPIPLVELGNSLGFPETVEFQVTMKNLQLFLTKLSQLSGLGYRLRPDFTAKKIHFEVHKGVDRTASQGINSRVIFSEAYENLNRAMYKSNNQLYKSQAIVGGEGEGADRVFVTVGGGAGLDLRQIFVDARDLRSDGISAAQYRANLTQRGLEWLESHKMAESFECETLAEMNFKYREHYDLGDIVTVRHAPWGITSDMRITEVQEVYQNGGIFISPTLGNPLPDKLNWED